MGSLYKQIKTKPIPEGAEIVRRRKGKVARWEDKYGTQPAHNNGYDTLGIPVPLGRIREIALEVLGCGPQQNLDFIGPQE